MWTNGGPPSGKIPTSTSYIVSDVSSLTHTCTMSVMWKVGWDSKCRTLIWQFGHPLQAQEPMLKSPMHFAANVMCMAKKSSLIYVVVKLTCGIKGRVHYTIPNLVWHSNWCVVLIKVQVSVTSHVVASVPCHLLGCHPMIRKITYVGQSMVSVGHTKSNL